MTIASLRQLSATRASNTDLGGINTTGTGLISTVDDTIREFGGQIAEYLAEMSYPTVGGTADALTLTPTTPLAALADDTVYTGTIGASANATTTPTLNVSGLGAKAIRKMAGGVDVAPAVGDLAALTQFTFVYKTAANSAAGGWIAKEAAPATLSTIGPLIAALTGKTTPVSADGFLLTDSAASNAAKFLTFANLKAALTTPVTINPQASGYTFLAADQGKLVQFTGSSDQTFPFTAAATLGSGWWCYFQNAGTSQARITLDPNASEQIDGLTSYKSYPGEIRLITCDGTKFTSIVIQGFQMRYLSTVSNDPVPPGYQRFLVDLWGGGGAGGCRSTTGCAIGGAGGCHYQANYLASAIGATWTATIGAGAVAVASSNANGGTGGQTTFTPLVGSPTSVFGGAGGMHAAAGTDSFGSGGGGNASAGTIGTGGTGPGGGSISTKEINTQGGDGGNGTVQAAVPADGGAGSLFSALGNVTQPGQRSMRGGCSGAGTSSANAISALGGTGSEMGGKGGDVSSGGLGTAGAQPGGGGAGSRNGNASGAGGSGEVRIIGIV